MSVYTDISPYFDKGFVFETIRHPVALVEEEGCDPTSLKLEGSYYSDLHKVCNVNNKPKLLPTERNGTGERFYIFGIDYSAALC